MRNHRHGVIGITLLVALVIAALIAGACATKVIESGRGPDAVSMQAAGTAIGAAVAGPAGAAIGGQLGYILALLFGIAAAQRHGAATAAIAQVRTLTANTTRPAP